MYKIQEPFKNNSLKFQPTTLEPHKLSMKFLRYRFRLIMGSVSTKVLSAVQGIILITEGCKWRNPTDPYPFYIGSQFLYDSGYPELGCDYAYSEPSLQITASKFICWQSKVFSSESVRVE